MKIQAEKKTKLFFISVSYRWALNSVDLKLKSTVAYFKLRA